MLDKITTALDVVGAGLIAAGVGIIFGTGAALIAAGVLILAGSFMAAMGDAE